MRQLQRLFWLTGMFSVMLASAAQADSLEVSTISAPEVVPVEELNRSEEPEPATTVEEWIGQIEAQERPDAAAELAQALTEITGVQVSETENGLELILEAAEPLAEPQTSVVGNALTADIPNAVLALPDEDAFEQFDPAEGIALVSVTELPDGGVRVSITGTDAPPEAQVRAEAGNLVFGVVPGIAQAGDADEAIQIVVTGEQDTGYRVDRATTATRTDTPIRDVPQSIQVIPRQVLEDQGANEIVDALRNVPGATILNPLRNNGGTFVNLRGFQNADDYFINGRRAFNGFLPPSTSNIEQIEVLSGPASVLYGNAAPGGIINLTTKQPLAVPLYALDGTIGNFDFYRSTLDLSGPLNDSRSIRYRLNAEYEDSGSFVDSLNTERFFVAPVLSFQLGDNTTLLLEGSYNRDFRVSYPGLPPEGTVVSNPLGDVPLSRFLGEPDFPRTGSEQFDIGYRFEHRFSDTIRLRNSFNVSFFNSRRREISLRGLQEDNRTVNRSFFEADTDDEVYSLITDLTATLRTGSVQHDLLFGVEWLRNSPVFPLRFPELSPIDLFEPNFGAELIESETFTFFNRTNRVGVYGQNLITLTDNLKMLLGGRFDWVRSTDGQILANGDRTSTSAENTAFSPRIGIVYQPIEPVSLYASWGRSFQPEFGISQTGETFDPTRGEQFEVGVKTEFLDGRLAATLAAYNLTRQNIPTVDPDNPGFRIQIGEQRSRGIEFNLAGEPLPGLRLIAGYAYIDAEITEDTRGFQGNQPGNVPQHSGSLWAVYEIQDGNLAGLGFGSGVFVVGDRQGNLENTFTLPAYGRVDALLYYRRDNWRAQLNFQNLFDANFIESGSNNSVSPGAPFTIRGQVAVTF